MIVFCCGFTFQTIAQNLPKTEKSIKQQYNLFHPTPKDSLREMDPDRPNVTESPYTADAGHLMYESDFVRYKYKTSAESKEHALLYSSFNAKLGLTNGLDVQVMFQTYAQQHTQQLATKEKTKENGFGDLTIRIKKNVLGDDGNVAIAILPYLTFPTNQYEDNVQYEGGLIVPVMFKLKNNWQLSAQVEFDRLKNDTGEGMHSELVQTIDITHPIFTKKLNAFLETYYEYNLNEHYIYNYADVALQYAVSKSLMFDVGYIYGIQKAADHALFAGITFRL